jgi:hypothetical protein
MEQQNFEENKIYTRSEVREILDAIAHKIIESNTVYMHSMLLINKLLRLPNAREIFDADLKQLARDLWIKMKSTGLQLNDPPLLFAESDLTNGATKQ